jgi:hypothetical protein
MYNFIILGLVPGTDIQITFEMWFKTFAGILGVGILLKSYRVLGSETQPLQMIRTPMHATQLHHRVI